MPKVSIIMSVFNEEKYLLKAIKSILNQSFTDFEFIVIDDASTDRTPEILQGVHDRRVHVISNLQNQGLTKNLNDGLKIARGTYIARMDGDDYCSPNRLEKQVSYLRKNPEISLISCHTETFGEERFFWRLPDNSETLRVQMLLRPVLAHPGFMMRREVFEKFGYFYDESFRTAQDYDFASRVSQKLKIGIVPEVLLYYRASEKQISRQHSEKQMENANRVRRNLLQTLGVNLTKEQWNTYLHWAVEKQKQPLHEFQVARQLIHLIVKQNVKQKLYNQDILEKTLKQMLYCWVIRNKKGSVYLGVPSLCDYRISNYKLFFNQFVRVARKGRF